MTARDLRPWVEARLAEAGRPRPARIWLLSFPRILGYGVQPAVGLLLRRCEGRLESVLYEVKNTFGDQHPTFWRPTRPDGAIRHGQDKGFFVSPFIGMDQTYAFTLRPPGERLAVKIRQRDARRPLADRDAERHPPAR